MDIDIKFKVKGAAAEKIIDLFFSNQGYSVSRSKDSNYDRLIQDKKIEIKFSTEWDNDLGYVFQQIRNQDYDYIVCLGVMPSDAHLWVIPKDKYITEWENGINVKSQHGGATSSETSWFRVIMGKSDDWLKHYGGTIEEGLDVFEKLVRS